MKRIFLRFFFVLLCSFMSASWFLLQASLAFPHPFQYTLPDGSVLTLQVHGDEFFHYTTDEQGYLLKQQPDGYYYYARFDANGVLQASPDRCGRPSAYRSKTIPAINRLRAKEKRQEFNQNILKQSHLRAAVTGSNKQLVILVNFADCQFSSDEAPNRIRQRLCQPNYTEDGLTGSAFDYFVDNSKGLFRPEFVVVGPYTLSKKMEYYGGNDDNGSDKNPFAMALEAVELAHADGVDLSLFNNDNIPDRLDQVYIIYAGQGEAAGGSEETIWPHAMGFFTNTIVDGASLKMGAYACSAELNSKKNLEGIGTFCHEFSHTLGLPDFYDVDYEESGGKAAGLGTLSLMSSGCYNNQTNTPPYYTAEERLMVGWDTPIPLPQEGEISLAPIFKGESYLYQTVNDGEYFIFENRYPHKWDAHISGKGGLVIYHVDKSANCVYDGWTAAQMWQNHQINVYPLHECMRIVRASNLTQYFPEANHNEFSANSSPAAVTWSGTPWGFGLYDIEKQDSLIQFVTRKDAQSIKLGGTVNTSSGKTVAGATVSLTKIGASGSEAMFSGLRMATHYTSLTDKKGNYLFDQIEEAGSYQLSCWHNDYAFEEQTIEIADGIQICNIRLYTEEEKRCKGTLTWTDGPAESYLYNSEAWEVGIRFEPEDMVDYRDTQIEQLGMYVGKAASDLVFTLYSGDKPFYTKNIPASKVVPDRYNYFSIVDDSVMLDVDQSLTIACLLPKADNSSGVGVNFHSYERGKSDLYRGSKESMWSYIKDEIDLREDPKEELHISWLLSALVFEPKSYVPVESLELNRHEAHLKVGDTLQLKASIQPINASNPTPRWKSSDSAVVYVSQTGLLTALKEGKSTITVRFDKEGIEERCEVEVQKGIRSSIKVYTSFHKLYFIWDQNQADNWKFLYKSTEDSVYQDIRCDSTELIINGLCSGTSYDYCIEAYLADSLMEAYQNKVTTKVGTGSFPAIHFNKANMEKNGFLILDAQNVADGLEWRWFVDDTPFDAPLLPYDGKMHHLRLELVSPDKGTEVIQRTIFKQ